MSPLLQSGHHLRGALIAAGKWSRRKRQNDHRDDDAQARPTPQSRAPASDERQTRAAIVERHRQHFADQQARWCKPRSQIRCDGKPRAHQRRHRGLHHRDAETRDDCGSIKRSDVGCERRAAQSQPPLPGDRRSTRSARRTARSAMTPAPPRRQTMLPGCRRECRSAFPIMRRSSWISEMTGGGARMVSRMPLPASHSSARHSKTLLAAGAPRELFAN